MSATPIITSILPYFGGKRTLAPEIVREIGAHRSYWEPFCGSLAVCLAKEPCQAETVNDRYGAIVNLARVLQDEPFALDLYGRVHRLLFSETLCGEANARSRERQHQDAPETPDVAWAADLLAASWMGRNGNAGTDAANSGFCVRYTSNGGAPTKRWQGVVESIPAWHHRLRNVTILNRDAFEVIGRIEDRDGTVIYCDPPYLVKGAKYVHDFDDDDHARLASALGRFQRTRVVVSYYAHPRLAELYPGWRCREIVVTKSLVNQGQRDKGGATKATEVLLVNDQQRTLF